MVLIVSMAQQVHCLSCKSEVHHLLASLALFDFSLIFVSVCSVSVWVYRSLTKTLTRSFFIAARAKRTKMQFIKKVCSAKNEHWSDNVCVCVCVFIVYCLLFMCVCVCVCVSEGVSNNAPTESELRTEVTQRSRSSRFALLEIIKMGRYPV